MRFIPLMFAALLLTACPPEPGPAAPTATTTTTPPPRQTGVNIDTQCVPVAGKYCCQCSNQMFQEIVGDSAMQFCNACDSFCRGNGGTSDRNASHGGGC